MCCSATLAKCFLVIINIVFFLIGAVVLVLGILAKYYQDVLLRLFSYVPDQLMDDVNQAWDIPSLLAEAAVLLIVIGCIIFPIGFFGCCGALKENKCMLGSYVAILLAILTMEVATIIIVCVKTQGAEDTVITSLQNSIQKNYFDSEGGLSFDDEGKLKFAIRPIKLAWDGIQIALGCCGAINGSDYVYANFSGKYNFTMDGTTVKIENAQIPLSCCSFVNKEEYEESRKDFNPDAPQSKFGTPSSKLKLIGTAKKVQSAVTDCLQELSPMYTNQKGCYKTFWELIEDYWVLFVGFLVAVIALEVVALTCACTIMRLKDNRDGYSKPM